MTLGTTAGAGAYGISAAAGFSAGWEGTGGSGGLGVGLGGCGTGLGAGLGTGAGSGSGCLTGSAGLIVSGLGNAGSIAALSIVALGDGASSTCRTCGSVFSGTVKSSMGSCIISMICNANDARIAQPKL